MPAGAVASGSDHFTTNVPSVTGADAQVKNCAVGSIVDPGGPGSTRTEYSRARRERVGHREVVAPVRKPCDLALSKLVWAKAASDGGDSAEELARVRVGVLAISAPEPRIQIVS